MPHYELLFILPGTLAETEAATFATEVQETLTAEGATELSYHDMGKSRLAYPMKHIRYGYFNIVRFDAEPAVVPVIEQKLRLKTFLLRAIVTKADKNKPVTFTKLTAISDVLQRDNVAKPAKSAAPDARAAAVMETKTITKKEKKVTEKKTETPKETKAEDVDLGDIDKKLDQLLDTDIADV